MDAPALTKVARPLVVFGLLAAVLAVVWWGTPSADDAREHRFVALVTEQVALRLEDYFRHRLAVVDDLAREWGSSTTAGPEDLQARATVVQASYSGLLAINWVDARGIIQNVAPYAPNRTAIGRDVHSTPEAGEALEEARRTQRMVVSAPLALFQGGTGVVAYAPVIRSSTVVVGFVNGVFRTEDAILDCLRAQTLTDFDVRIEDGSVAVLASALPDESPSSIAHAQVAVGGRTWTVSVAPRVVLPSSRRERALLALAIVFAAAVASAVRLAAQRRALLDRSEARSRAIVEALPDMVVEARDDGTVTAVHGAGRRKLMTPEVEANLGAEIATALKKAASHSFEVPILTEGVRRWLEVRVSSLAYGEGLALVRDVTDRHEAEDEQRRLETQLRHAQKLEAIGQLAGGIAHDFNNLMTAVIAHAELARASVADNAEVAEDIDQISHVARRATQLTTRLLMFSRREKGEPRPLLMGELVRGLAPMLRRLVRENIALTVVADDQPVWIMADPSQIEQVVVNLVMNASDAMPVAGRVEIEVHARAGDPSKGEPDGPCAELLVRDSGVGMTVTTRERLFEPYFTTKEAGRGSGLGLAIVYGVVTHARGRIHVESVVGHGSTFRVVLPSITPPAPGSDADIRAVEPGWGTVLLVEDDALVRRAAVRALERGGYAVVEAENGQEAVATLAEKRGEIRVVVTDLVMPVMGGRELVEWMTHNRAEIPIVLISGYAEDIAGLDARVVQIVPKPYSPGDLTHAVRQALSRRKGGAGDPGRDA